jgi:hypothetical protein
MNYLTIRKWGEWQSYRKDRQLPPWIKLHRCLLRNTDWIYLSDAQRGHLVSIWMLAADKNGRIPDDPKLIQRMCHLDKPPDLNMLISRGFIDARVTPRRRRCDAPEESRVDTEERESSPPKRSSQIEEDWQPSPENLLLLKTKGHTDAFVASELEKFRDHHRSKGNPFKDKDAAFRKWMANAKEWSAAKGDGARKNGAGWYVKKDSEEYRAWMRHALKVNDYPLQGRLQYATDEVKVPSRWPSR